VFVDKVWHGGQHNLLLGWADQELETHRPSGDGGEGGDLDGEVDGEDNGKNPTPSTRDSDLSEGGDQ
jgi:hypothetical protein